MPVEFEAVYTLDGRRGRRTATITDLSAGGGRLAVAEDLPSGSLITLELVLPGDFVAAVAEKIGAAPRGFEPMTLRAQVLATFFSTSSCKLIHRVAFAGIETRAQAELERFMHLRQLHHLRTRSGI